ncbi:hypothetical protein LEN26_012648 [Aphanomyces euteiches]|nr:hypothetical protein AeMF1_008937 [Aphanomyces euteiches]KAH9117508.1 hypothetical protein LEN26_012648 [Aphanomyces euteiches]KAH9190562.1 hypothetical protein AeNC1_007466 [Aphanomyces euteiches]
MYGPRGDEHIVARKEWFFRRLLSSDARQRAITMQKIRDELAAMEPQLLEAHLGSLRRLARDAPLADVRTGCLSILDELQVAKDVDDDVPVSYYIDQKDVIDVATNEDPELDEIFVKCFLQSGRVTHLIRLLAWHTPYLQMHRGLISSIMLSDGPLPVEWRNYIALMAASEYRCHYVSILQQHYFLINGGDATWLDGLDFVPPKLARLHSLNALLAHQPWLVTSDDVADLLASGSDGASWSVSELVHAIVVLCMFHSISSIALGLGCVDEVDMVLLTSKAFAPPYRRSRRKSSSLSSSGRKSESSGPEYDLASIEKEEAILRDRLLRDPSSSSDEDNDDDCEEEESEETNGEEGYFDLAALPGSIKRRRRGESVESHYKGDMWRYCSETIEEYTDFDVRSSEYSVLHTEDFSWDEHCFSLVNRYFPGPGGSILEELFKLTMKLTYNTYGAHPNQEDESVDTTPFRHAIWYYVHRIYGICHDDYDYKNVNHYLNRPTKLFVKKVACTPWRVNAKDVEHFSHTLTASEKCHVTLLAAEARKQAGLMYGLRAVMQHFL